MISSGTISSSRSEMLHMRGFSKHINKLKRLHNHTHHRYCTVQSLASSQNTDRTYLYCLERSLNAGQGLDGALWNSGHFYAQVYPDLPIASSWHDLFQKIMSPSTHQNSTGTTMTTDTNTITVEQQSKVLVRTVGAQCRSQQELHTKIKSYFHNSNNNSNNSNTNNTTTNTTTPGALLFVSGSHPARKLPFITPFLQNSISLLHDASLMKQYGDIPSSTLLWAVENPNLNSVDRLHCKIDAGADTILTQPLFDRAVSETWFSNANLNRKEEKKGRIFAGLPMVSSLKNLIFWLQLCDLANTPIAQSIVSSFPQSDEFNSKEELKKAIWQWNADFTQWTLSLDGVDGLHIMPLTKQAREMTIDFFNNGILPRPSTTSK